MRVADSLLDLIGETPLVRFNRLVTPDGVDVLVNRLAPARRKSELLNFARRAARRLSAQIDPTLGEAS